MEQHPIENLMVTAMSSIENMIDVNTIIGDIVNTPDGSVIIPVSKVSFGFAAGGSEFVTESMKNIQNKNLPFGGGSGAGVNIAPVGFLIIKDGIVKLLNIDSNGPIDKLIDNVPDIINKANDLIKNKAQNDENRGSY